MDAAEQIEEIGEEEFILIEDESRRPFLGQTEMWF